MKVPVIYRPFRTYTQIMLKDLGKPHTPEFSQGVIHNLVVMSGTFIICSALWKTFVNWFNSPAHKLVQVVRVQSEQKEEEIHG